MKARTITPTRQQVQRGLKKGTLEHRAEDALEAYYRPDVDSIVLSLVSGVTVIVPRSRVPELARLSRRTLKGLTLTKFGEAIEVSDEDLHISVRGVVRRALGADHSERGGRARTSAKVSAARLNGRNGGRPRIAS